MPEIFWNRFQREWDHHQLDQLTDNRSGQKLYEQPQDTRKQKKKTRNRKRQAALPSQSCRLCGATEGQMTRLLASKRGFMNLASSSDRFTQDHRDMVFCVSFSLDLVNPKDQISFWFSTVKTHFVLSETCRLGCHRHSCVLPAQTNQGWTFLLILSIPLLNKAWGWWKPEAVYSAMPFKEEMTK